MTTSNLPNECDTCRHKDHPGRPTGMYCYNFRAKPFTEVCYLHQGKPLDEETSEQSTVFGDFGGSQEVYGVITVDEAGFISAIRSDQVKFMQVAHVDAGGNITSEMELSEDELAKFGGRPEGTYVAVYSGTAFFGKDGGDWVLEDYEPRHVDIAPIEDEPPPDNVVPIVRQEFAAGFDEVP